MFAFATIYWLQGGKVIHLFVSCLVSVPLLLIVMRYQLSNQGTLLDSIISSTAISDNNYTLHLKAALAYGGLWGHQSEQTLWSRNYLPFGFSNSIFATFGESIGFVGLITIVLGVISWFAYNIYIARKQRCMRSALVIIGLSTILVAQAFIHISITLGLLPPLGASLPMFSYGGSSLVSTLASVGIIFSFSKEKSIEIDDH